MSGQDVYASEAEAWIVSADDDPNRRPKRSDKTRDPERRRALKRHHRHGHDIRLDVADQTFDGCAHGRLHEDQIGNRHAMVRIHVARQRCQGAVRHADRHRRHVLERIGHRQEQQVHSRLGY